MKTIYFKVTKDGVTQHYAMDQYEGWVYVRRSNHGNIGGWKIERYNRGKFGRAWVRAFWADNGAPGCEVSF